MVAQTQAAVRTSDFSAGRQLSFAAHVDFDVPAHIDTDRLAGWLAWMADDQAHPPAVDGHDAAPQCWAGYGLRCARLLFHSITVPIFDLPELLRCEPLADGSPTRWRAHFRLAAIPTVPSPIYESVMRVAFVLLPWMNAHEQSRASRASIERVVLERIIQPARGSIKAGKSTLPVLRIAHARGIPFQAAGRSIYRLGWGSRARYLDRSATSGDGLPGWRICEDKVLTARLLATAGLPAPTHELANDPADIRATGDRLGWPIVVKPADGERGEGVNVDVGRQDVERAFSAARAASRSGRVLAERQVSGTCHRLFIAWGRLLYAVKRLPNGVYGDGRTSVATLVASAAREQTEKPVWLRSPCPQLDGEALATLASSGLTPQTVPAANQFVPLRRIESTAAGGVDEEVTDTIHPENLRAALSAVALLGLDVAGVDFISSNIAEPWYANGAIINEVNGAPLLGGGAISRSHVPEFLNRLLGGDGRIPIEVHVGSSGAWQAARERARALKQAGYRTFLTSGTETVDDGFAPVHMASNGLASRARGLVLQPAVDAVLLVVDTDEILHSRSFLEGIDRFSVDDRILFDHRDPARQLQDDEVEAVLAYLRQWLWPRVSDGGDQLVDGGCLPNRCVHPAQVPQSQSSSP